MSRSTQGNYTKHRTSDGCDVHVQPGQEAGGFDTLRGLGLPGLERIASLATNIISDGVPLQ